MKQIAIFTITGYQMLLSPVFTSIFGVRCRFEQSCSHYAQKVIAEFGFFKGSMLALKRLLSCQPFAKI